jgi:predicted DNA-binding protein
MQSKVGIGMSKKQTVSVRMDQELYERLLTHAAQDQRPTSNYVTRVLKQWFAKVEQEAAQDHDRSPEDQAEA